MTEFLSSRRVIRGEIDAYAKSVWAATIMHPFWDHCAQYDIRVTIAVRMRYRAVMRVVGRDRLCAAMDVGEIPAVPACTWLAEVLEARWTELKDVSSRYANLQVIDDRTISVPLDDAGHCVVFLIDFQLGLVVIQFAGHERARSMKKRRMGVRS